jgi:hypothetical protein
VGEFAAMVGMTLGFVSVVYLKIFTPIAFTWYVAAGSGVTFVSGYIASFLIKEKTING